MVKLKRISFDKNTVYGESTNSCGGLLTVYEYRQTDIWVTFFGIKLYIIFSYKLIPVGYHWDYPPPSSDTDMALRLFRDGYKTNKIKYVQCNG